MIRAFVALAVLGLGQALQAATEADGPIGAQTPVCKWGSVVFDAHNGEHLWFGGTGGQSTQGALLTWRYKDGVWTEADFGTEKEKVRFTEAGSILADARLLYVKTANRYYRAERGAESATALDQTCAAVIKRLDALTASLTEAHARDRAANARALLAALQPRLSKAVNVSEVADARTAWYALVELERAVSLQPPPRCYPIMAYDASAKKILLFGGEGIYGVYNDTWIYDCLTRRWSMRRPAHAPSPRLSCGVLADNGKIYVVGGFETAGSYSYTALQWKRTKFQLWVYDLAANTWTLWDPGTGKQEATMYPFGIRLTLAGNTLSYVADVVSFYKVIGTLTGSFNVPGTDAGTASQGAAPGLIQVRPSGFNPAHYETAPAPDAAGFATFLANVPSNQWVSVNVPIKHINRDWGTTVLDLDRDQLLRWAGGHSSHCGTDVAHYSLTLNRWHIYYTPELPFEYCYSNDGSPVPSLSGAPWGPHSYLSYAWDPITGKVPWCGDHMAYRMTNPAGVFVYDPSTCVWERSQFSIQGGWFHAERHKTATCTTPQGIATWGIKVNSSSGRSALWMADVANHTYRPVAGNAKADASYPFCEYGDRHGITYDSRRNRTLMFNFQTTEKYKTWATDLETKQITAITPEGSTNFPSEMNLGREATYLPDDDCVLICTKDNKAGKALVYNCATNAWLEAPIPLLAYPYGYGVSTGIEWDPKRHLIWRTETDGSIWVMRFNRATANLKPLSGTPMTNQAPVVNAGSAISTAVGRPAMLNGAVTDDGLPTGAEVARTWSRVSGPGTVTFANATAASTTATFSAAGVYVLKLTGQDTALTSSAEVTVTVTPSNP